MTILAHAIFRNAFSSKFVFWRGLCQLESRDALRHPTCPIWFELFAQNSSTLYIPCLFLQPTLRTHTLSPVLTEWCCQNCVPFMNFYACFAIFNFNIPTLLCGVTLARVDLCSHGTWDSLCLDSHFLRPPAFLRSYKPFFSWELQCLLLFWMHFRILHFILLSNIV